LNLFFSSKYGNFGLFFPNKSFVQFAAPHFFEASGKKIATKKNPGATEIEKK
jgi:hypothetical protein